MATRNWPSYKLLIANVTFNNLIRIFHLRCIQKRTKHIFVIYSVLQIFNFFESDNTYIFHYLEMVRYPYLIFVQFLSIFLRFYIRYYKFNKASDRFDLTETDFFRRN